MNVGSTDLLDADTGANGLQNRPEFVDVRMISPHTVAVDGQLDSEAGEQYRIDFYISPNRGQAREHLGYLVTGATDVDGHVEFSNELVLHDQDHRGSYLTMTASRLVCEAGACPIRPVPHDGLFRNVPDEFVMFGGTSELSESVSIAN